jgi:hypothetical protein
LRALAALAEREEVLLPLTDWFRSAPRLPEQVASRLAARRAAYDQLSAQLPAVHAALRASGVPHAFLKGFGYQHLQRPGYLRQMDDIDIALHTVDDGWAAVAALRPLGYQVAAATVGRGRQGWLSVLVLEIPGGADLELNCGGMLMHWYSALEFPDSMWRELAEPAGVPFPGRRWSAAIFLAEMLDRPALRLRDRLDAAAVFGRLDAGELSWVAGLAARHRLDGELRAVQDAVPGLAGGRRPGRGRWRATFPTLTRSLTHVLPGAVAEHGLRPGVRIAARAAMRDRISHRLERGTPRGAARLALRWLNRLDLDRAVPAAGCLTLVPLDPDRTGDLRVTRAGSQWTVTLPIGWFLATAIPVVEQSQLDEVMRPAPDRAGPDPTPPRN